MKIRGRQIFSVGIVLCSVLLVIAVGLQQEARYNSATKAMVYIVSGEYGGNGSVYKINVDELVVVTTWHLLKDNESVMVYFPDQTTAEGSVIAVNKEHDVGFVSIDISQLTSETLAEISCVLYDDSTYAKVQAGDTMEYRYLEWNGGHISATSQKGSIGHMNWYIEDFDDYFIYNYCDVEPGMSGSAAVVEDGTYIGMMIGGNTDESGALSIQVIEKIYAEID